MAIADWRGLVLAVGNAGAGETERRASFLKSVNYPLIGPQISKKLNPAETYTVLGLNLNLN
jgi:hypothetical protein